MTTLDTTNITVAVENRRESTIVENIRESMAIQQGNLSLSSHDYWIASKEMALRYWPFCLLAFFTNSTWVTTTQLPSFYSSSATYAGQDGEEAGKTADLILLTGHLVVFFIGLLILTPIGSILPQTQKPYLLWIPTLVQLAILITVIIGLMWYRMLFHRFLYRLHMCLEFA